MNEKLRDIEKRAKARVVGIVIGACLLGLFYWYFTIYSDDHPTLKLFCQWSLIILITINSITISLQDFNKEIDKEIEEEIKKHIHRSRLNDFKI